jgi:hypothetical protein
MGPVRNYQVLGQEHMLPLSIPGFRNPQLRVYTLLGSLGRLAHGYVRSKQCAPSTALHRGVLKRELVHVLVIARRLVVVYQGSLTTLAVRTSDRCEREADLLTLANILSPVGPFVMPLNALTSVGSFADVDELLQTDPFRRLIVLADIDQIHSGVIRDARLVSLTPIPVELQADRLCRFRPPLSMCGVFADTPVRRQLRQ